MSSKYVKKIGPELNHRSPFQGEVVASHSMPRMVDWRARHQGYPRFVVTFRKSRKLFLQSDLFLLDRALRTLTMFDITVL